MKRNNNNKDTQNIEFHSVANLFPLMKASEFESLKLSIKTNGLQNPIWLFDGKIIDGRNRYKACLEVGIKPKFETFKGSESDLIPFVLDLNLQRRHLTTSQKSCLAVELLPIIEKRNKELFSSKMSAIRKGANQESAKTHKLDSNLEVAELFGIGKRIIFEAKKLQSLNPDLFLEVRKGNIKLAKAIKQQNEVYAKTHKPEQAKISPESSIILTNADLKKVAELVSELGISESKAKDYIIKKKATRKPKTSNSSNVKSIMKVVLDSDLKEKLKLIAEAKHTTQSELLRAWIKKLK